MTVPVFAVVGHPNKGKSSIVATLAERSDVDIGPLPGTTRTSRRFTFAIGDNAQYVLVDTPGFQRARDVIAWMQAHATDASGRAELVRLFVEAHRHDPRFADEIELLTPVVDGASIIYVVDGAKPYSPDYEQEMEILRWTGQPRMALINRIGAGDHVDRWRQALGQYFSLVREFNAVQADFAARIGVLRALAELHGDADDTLPRVIAAMQRERRRRLDASAGIICGLLSSCLARAERSLLSGGETVETAKEKLVTRLLASLRREEASARAAVESVYGYHGLEREGETLDVVASDLFAQSSWELFGLSRRTLLLTAALGGAAAGGTLDALVGGASMLLGTVLGGVVGGAGALLAADELAKVRVLGTPLGGKVVSVGPVSAPNFPWVLIGRALLHHRLVSERNHARREKLALEARAAQHAAEAIPDTVRRQLAVVFDRLRRGASAETDRQRLTDLLRQMLGGGDDDDQTAN
ncbi:MAG: DUF3482 domain-containing protein [Pseudomonadales bacterium]|nr:DUF3482 domain-containing protein [Pseudomonadales bacterium]